MRYVDIAALWDSGALNAGFVAIKPSPAGQQVYQTIRQLTSEAGIDDQQAFNQAVRSMKKWNQQDEIVLRVKVLDKKQFVSGVEYFEKSRRKIPKPDDECKALSGPKSECPLVVHNNWIVSKEAKIYRFREHLMWLYDGDDQYYSSETRKYLTYTNTKPTTTQGQISALKTALAIGHLLNRAVILPRFHCLQECLLNSFIHIKTFDTSFSGHYRESSFLQHPKVPDSVKHSVVDRRYTVTNQTSTDVHISRTEILHLFGELNARILNVGKLRQVKVDLDDSEFNSRLQTAFRRAHYRQIH